MKFHFTFEKVLTHKRGLEDSARRDLNNAAAKLKACETELQALYQAIDYSREQAVLLTREETPGKAGSDSRAKFSAVSSLVQIDDFIRGQGVRIELQKSKVREHKAIVEEAQEVLLEAAKERKIYEKLRERRLEEFKDTEKKRELKRVDDMIVTRFKNKES